MRWSTWHRMAARTPLAAVLLVAALAGLAQPARAAGTGSVHGTVLARAEDGTTTPRAGVCVEPLDEHGSFTSPVATDADGRYRFDVEPGTYRLWAFDCGYPGSLIDQYYSGTRDWGDATLVTVTAGSDRTADWTLDESTSISGRVVVPQVGATRPTACVTALTATGDYAGSTSAAPDGTYSIVGLLPGDYRIGFASCEPSDLFGEWYLGASSSQAATLVTTHVDAPASGIDGTLRVGPTITGRITTQDGTAVAGACVFARATDPDSTAYAQGYADEEGAYRLGPLPDGDYVVRAYGCRDTDDALQGFHPDAVDSDDAEPVAIRLGLGATGVDVALPVGTSFSGRVTDGSGQGIFDVCVDAEPVGDVAYGQGRTDGQGRYTVHHLPLGATYRVVAEDCTYPKTWLESYWRGSWRTASGETLTTNRAPRTGIDVQLGPGGRIRGRILDPDGKPAQVCVDVSRTDDDDGGYDGDWYNRGNGNLDVGRDGRYEVRALPPGTFALSFGASCAGLSDLMPLSVPRAATLRGEETATRDVQLARGATISGHVYAGAGTASPLGVVCVYASPRDPSGGGAYGTAESDLLGAWSIRGLTPGTAYEVRFDPCLQGMRYRPQLFGEVGERRSAAVLTPTLEHRRPASTRT